MDDTLRLPLFSETLPEGLKYGANYLVEFEPQSLWFETSVTICAQALRGGARTDYHVFTRPPDEVRRALRRFGVDVDKLESDDTFRIIDSYTVQTSVGHAKMIGKADPRDRVDLHSVKMADWDERGSLMSGDVAEVDRRRLHIDDNTSVLVQFNTETSVVEHFRTRTLPLARKMEMAAVHAVATGMYSQAFYRQFESFCDGVIDFQTREEGETIGHFMRFRFARGAGHDSSWKRLVMQGSGEVGAVTPQTSFSGRAEAMGERRLAAIMFTDMAGFTAVGQRDEQLAMKLLDDQRRFVRPLLAKYNGREVKTIGDAFLVEFASSLEAMKCAVEIQETLRSENLGRSQAEKLLVRVGIHLGDVIHHGSDVAGDAVNVASRIEALAPPGGVCVTSQVHASVVNKVPYEFESLGTPELKNVSTPIEVFRVTGIGEPAATKKAEGEGPAVDRIAIIPFPNISPDKSDDYFADGLTEELISSVSRRKGLRVIARTSVMKYKGTSKSVADIGRELNVGSVLEGSVRKSGDKIRITVVLVATKNEEPKWSQVYDRELKDVFAIQSDIAEKVAESLKVQVLGAPAVPGAGSGSADPEAYLYYLRGRQAWNRRTKDELSKAVGYFEEALKLDSRYAKAYTGLADCYASLALLEFMPPNEAYPKAKEAVGKALAIDPTLAEAHTSLGLIRFQYDYDWAGAEQELREAVKINPSYAPAHHFFADYLKAMGRFDEALAQISKAQGLDPLSLAINTGVGHVLYLSGDYDRAIEQYRKAVELEPGFMATHLWFGRPYLEKGMYPEAISELETAVRLSGESTLALAMLGHGLASAGRGDEARKILEKLKERSKSEYVPAYWVAVIYNGFRDRAEVTAWMKKAYEERSSWLVWSNVEPRFAWLRGDPEFGAVMSLMKFPRKP